LVGSGVSGFIAPVSLVVAGGVGAAFASLGVTPGVLSEPGAAGSTGFSARTGVPARASIATAKTVAAYFILGNLLRN
jgi:hypothetical protein